MIKLAICFFFNWPECVHHPKDLDVVGYQVKPDILETLREDLDVRTIGTLIVMGANDAAYTIYSWGRFTKDYED